MLLNTELVICIVIAPPINGTPWITGSTARSDGGVKIVDGTSQAVILSTVIAATMIEITRFLSIIQILSG